MAKVDSGSISRAINLCNQATEYLQREISTLQSKYDAAGSGWKDEKYAQLGAIVSDCVQNLQKPIKGLTSCRETLQQISAALAEYEGVQI